MDFFQLLESEVYRIGFLCSALIEMQSPSFMKLMIGDGSHEEDRP